MPLNAHCKYHCLLSWDHGLSYFGLGIPETQLMSFLGARSAAMMDFLNSASYQSPCIATDGVHVLQILGGTAA